MGQMQSWKTSTGILTRSRVTNLTWSLSTQEMHAFRFKTRADHRSVTSYFNDRTKSIWEAFGVHSERSVTQQCQFLSAPVSRRQTLRNGQPGTSETETWKPHWRLAKRNCNTRQIPSPQRKTTQTIIKFWKMPAVPPWPHEHNNASNWSAR